MVFLAPEARYQPKICFPKLMPLFYCTCSLVPLHFCSYLMLFIKFFHVTHIILWGPYVAHSSIIWARKGQMDLNGPASSSVPFFFLFHFTPTTFNIKRKPWSFRLYMAEISQGSKIPIPHSSLSQKKTEKHQLFHDLCIKPQILRCDGIVCKQAFTFLCVTQGIWWRKYIEGNIGVVIWIEI